jgi:hypothetical protein
MSTRLSVNINDATADAIRASQHRRQTTATEVIRRAVSVYKFFVEAQERGDRVELVDDRTVTRVEFL